MTAAAATRSTRTANVRTPGVMSPPPDDGRGESDADALAAAAAPLDDGTDGKQEPQMVTLTQQQLDAAVARGVAQALAAQRRAESTPGKPEVQLPDQSEIDPTKILRPTLSRQGYVVPVGYGEPSDAAVKR